MAIWSRRRTRWRGVSNVSEVAAERASASIRNGLSYLNIELNIVLNSVDSLEKSEILEMRHTFFFGTDPFERIYCAGQEQCLIRQQHSGRMVFVHEFTILRDYYS